EAGGRRGDRLALAAVARGRGRRWALLALGPLRQRAARGRALAPLRRGAGAQAPCGGSVGRRRRAGERGGRAHLHRVRARGAPLRPRPGPGRRRVGAGRAAGRAAGSPGAPEPARRRRRRGPPSAAGRGARERPYAGEVHPRGAVLEGAGAVDRGEDAHDAGGGRLLPQRAERGAVAGRGAGGGGLAVAGAADPLGGVSRPPPPPWRRPRGPPSRLTPP
ncbi:unnamed protein product, partial [Prorocentrum cordatum]